MSNVFDQFDVAAGAATELPMAENPFDQFDPEPSTEQVEEEKGFLGRSMETLQEAGTAISDELTAGIDENYDTSNIDPATNAALGDPTRSPMQRAGSVVAESLGATSNILMDGGLSMIQSIMPDSWEESIKDYGRDKWEQLMANPTAREGIMAAQAGLEAYNAWAKENPDYAEAVSDAVAVGSLGRSKTPRRGDTYLKQQKRRGVSNRKMQAQEMLTPASKKNNYGKYYEDNRGTVRWDPSTWTREVIDEVVRVPDVKPGRSYVHNMNAVREASQSYKGQLDELVSAKGTALDTQKIKTGLANRVNRLADDTLLTGNPLDKAIKIYTKASKLIDEAEPTSMGMLQVRRDLDEWVRSQSNVFDADLESAVSIALKDIRSYLNDTVKKSTKSTRVGTLLDKQHKLLTAGDMMEEKAMKQSDTWAGRLRQKFENATGEKIPTTPLAQGATGAAIVGAASLAGGGVGATAAALLGGYKGLKWLYSPDGRQWMTKVVRLTDTYPQLKPEVNALVQLSQGLSPDEEEEAPANE